MTSDNLDSDLPVLGLDGIRNHVRWQGACLVWQRHQPWRGKPTPGKRKPCRDMSPASRLALLKFVAGIDWTKTGRCYFHTFTYPDKWIGIQTYQIAMHRSSLWRAMGDTEDTPMPAIWRVEWQKRLTGLHVGYFMPHLHVIEINAPFRDFGQVGEAWIKIVDPGKFVEYKGKLMKDPAQVGKYVAKYCGKVSSVLDNASNYNVIPIGRTHGKLRKRLIPLAEIREFWLPDSTMTDALREKCLAGRPQYNDYGNESFTLLGNMSRCVGMTLAGSWVDGEVPGW